MVCLNGAMVGRPMEDGAVSYTFVLYSINEAGEQEKTVFPFGFASPELLVRTLEKCAEACKTQKDIYIVNKESTAYDLVPNPLYAEAVDERK